MAKRMMLTVIVTAMFVAVLGFVKFRQIQTAIGQAAAFQPPPEAVTTIVASEEQWPSTLMAVNAIGYVCEAAYHHADLAVTWGKLWVKLRNHAAGGITDKDFEVARQIEDTVLWRPGDDSALEGNPNKFVFSKGGR